MDNYCAHCCQKVGVVVGDHTPAGWRVDCDECGTAIRFITEDDDEYVAHVSTVEAEAERTPREKSFYKNFTVISLGEAIKVLLSGKEVWACGYGEDTIQDDEDVEDMFTTVSLDDVGELTIKELMDISPFGI